MEKEQLLIALKIAERRCLSKEETADLVEDLEKAHGCEYIARVLEILAGDHLLREAYFQVFYPEKCPLPGDEEAVAGTYVNLTPHIEPWHCSICRVNFFSHDDITAHIESHNRTGGAL